MLTENCFHSINRDKVKLKAGLLKMMKLEREAMPPAILMMIINGYIVRSL